MNTNDVYKGFKVLSVSDVKDFASTAIYLRHEESGLEVFKMLNDDSENCFAFAFRTPCENSTGVAHAIEHSVLCGSAAYPLKDPFIRLANQSVNTYLNAYTCPDHTVYPSSSPVKADFYNVFSVYADAVFFPQLKEGVFLQECHRMELDAEGKPSIQGVVYNEMKGNYASFDDVAFDALFRPLMEGSEYVYDSGGDPLAIPSLTYEAFKDYHRRYYCTANCLCFLYGNIPLEEELDFLVEHVTSRISSPGQKASYPSPDFSRPVQERVRAFAPAGEGGGDSRRLTSVNWRVSDGIQGEDQPSFCMELSFLSELLWGDDSAPVCKKMLESKIGDAVAPYTGVSSSGRFPAIGFSMSGVKEGDEEKFQTLLLGILKELVDKGIPKEDFDRTVMGFDFENREIKRLGSAPYSIALMRRVVNCWLFGFPPDSRLFYRETFEALRKRIQDDPRLIPGLIKKHLLDNPRRTLVSVDPSAEWEKERADREQALVEAEFARLGKEGVLAQLKTMQDFQQAEEDEGCLPHLRISDLPRDIEKVTLEEEEVEGVPLFVSSDKTNGITYFDLGFPLDVLEPEDYIYLSSLGSLVSQVGVKGQRWDEFMSRLGTVTGGFGANPVIFEAGCRQQIQPDSSPYLNRDIFMFHFECLDEMFRENLGILSECLEGMDFSDTDRISDLLAANANDAKDSVLPRAHVYAGLRANAPRDPKLTVKEILYGLTSIAFAVKARDMDVQVLARKLESIYRTIVASEAVIHVTAEPEQLARIRPALSGFVKRHGLKPFGPRPELTEERFSRLLALTEFDGDRPESGQGSGRDGVDEVFIIPGSVAFDARSCTSSRSGTKEAVAESVFTHCLSKTDLWDKVRTKGGAYGVFFHPNSWMMFSTFSTYRDPKPYLSLEAMLESLEDDATGRFTDDEVEKSITGCYASEITPETPCTRGRRGFTRLFNGNSNEKEERKVAMLLSLNAEDLKEAWLRYRDAFRTETRTVILCPRPLLDEKVCKSTGKIITLPL